ncbi:43kDa postsynaptic protein [Trema orientale]|uniref:RING-type E3 ubiquitin transferase n=1 Tax=Trema orientale TaxID=63057 RepID=A0A2P5F703_TREOI|nr:43kDa postsynaptic protein [Trema orientale]
MASSNFLLFEYDGFTILHSDQDDNDWTIRLHHLDENESYFFFQLNNQQDFGVFTVTFRRTPLIIPRREYFSQASSVIRDTLTALRVEPARAESCVRSLYSNALAIAKNPNFANSTILTLTVQVTSPPNLSYYCEIEHHPLTEDELLEKIESSIMSDVGFRTLYDVEINGISTSDDDESEGDIELSSTSADDDDEEIERASTSEPTELICTIPASKSSIETLEEAKGDDHDQSLGTKTTVEHDQCSVCLEKLSFDEVVRMPCSHIYHKNCIVRWLETSHMCPLCRYAMPT